MTPTVVTPFLFLEHNLFVQGRSLHGCYSRCRTFVTLLQKLEYENIFAHMGRVIVRAGSHFSQVMPVIIENTGPRTNQTLNNETTLIRVTVEKL